MPATVAAPQTPLPGTPLPPVATPRGTSPERAAAAPETPKPAALTPFAPRKAAKGSRNEAQEDQMQVGICGFFSVGSEVARKKKWWNRLKCMCF